MIEHGNYLLNVREEIGNGGFGLVERVELYNSKGERCPGQFARKRLADDPYIYTSQGVVRSDIIKRFEREILYQEKCPHKNIVPIYLHSMGNNNPWYLMDLADKDLSKEIKANRLNHDQKIHAFRCILSGVKCIHDNGLLHRDIKPRNVLKFNDTYKIGDFGLVKNLMQDPNSVVLTQINDPAMGTERYIAPECGGQQYSPQSDIYAIGVLLEDLAIDSKFDSIIEKATNRRPAKRYTNVEEILNELNSIIGGEK
ncbi:protein kinase [Acinetobacter shaoyimingii]|uniref:Protein kinase n=2 Tax=Acinetobacter shaoyimingii TaxID=2715164 RepID=A0A6G8S092_9GAMM|nr:protein kinase [Acinetobacter shaoyimingii]